VRPARNDPCPCGSGRKYKRCCLPDAERARANLALVPGLASGVADLSGAHAAATPVPDAPWEAEIVPIPTSIANDPEARPAVALVCAGDLVLHADLVRQPPAEPSGIASVIAGALADAARRHGAAPAAVRVRHRAIAEALRAAATVRDAPIEARRTLPALDRAARSLLAHLGASERGRGAVGTSPTWRSWGLPEPAIRDLFAAAAAFHREAPWRDVANVQVLDAVTPGGTRWTVCVLGNGGNEFGLALYASREDFFRQIETDRLAPDALAALRGLVLSLTFSRRDELLPAMRQEILAAGWEVAAPGAYPVLLTVNAPAGSVTRSQAVDLELLLRAVPRFVERHRELLRSRVTPARPVRWRDADTGVSLEYDGGALLAPAPLWPPPARLDLALPAGAGADPAATLRGDDPDRIAGDHRGLLVDFAAAERAAGRASHLVERDRALLEFFIIEFLAYVEQTPLAASTEYDLRTFLYDWFPRKVRIPPDEAPGLLVALKRWFAHLARERGIEFPWAAAILADRDGFDERVRTFPGGFFWDEAVQVWQAAASADLDARLLLHDRRLGDAEQWGDTMGPVEYGLRHELQRRWLIWRDEVVRSGTTGPADVRAALVRRQREWEAAPHPEHGGWTVVEVVAEERKRHGSPGPVVHRRQRRKPHRRG